MIDVIKQLLIPYEYPNLKRYGGNYDGGYILAEDLLNNSDIIYSYGVGPDETWITFDRELAKLGKKVYLYDNLKNDFWVNDEPNFIFKREYVNSKNINKHIIENGHERNRNMILKMDIEGNEFETLLHCQNNIFSHFDQLAIEIHDVTNSHLEPYYLINANDSRKRWENKISLFNLINQFYNLVHIHGNNNSYKIIDGVPDVLELLYIRKDKFNDTLQVRTNPFPIDGLDYPNNNKAADIKIDWWIKK